MSLLVNLHHVEEKNLRLQGQVALAELDLDPREELIHLNQPLSYALEVQKLDQALLIQGSLRLDVDCECARCLKPFRVRLPLESWACHIPLQGEDAAAVKDDCVDLTPQIREDIFLAFP